MGIRNKTIVIIMCAAHTFNLETEGVRVFNRKLQQSMKIFTCVQMIIRIEKIPNMVYVGMDLVKTGLLVKWPHIRKPFSPKKTNSPIILNCKEKSESQSQKGSVLYVKRNFVRVA